MCLNLIVPLLFHLTLHLWHFSDQMSISILQIWQIFHEMQEETYEILIFNLKGWTNKGPKKTLLCLVTNQSFIVWFRTGHRAQSDERDFSDRNCPFLCFQNGGCSNLFLWCSSDSIEYMFLYFLIKKEYQELTLANNDQGSADTRLGKIQKSTSE